MNKTESTGILKELIETNVTRKLIPKGMSWFGCMGGVSLLAFILQLGTGIFLMCYFVPSREFAIDSLKHVTHTVPYGWLVQQLHSAGPHIMIGMVFCHMFRIFIKRIYRHPRELHWVSGACLLILTLLIYYTGTMLSVHNINKYSDIKLTFIYTIHVAGIPLTMAFFMGIHFFMIRKTGIYEPL